jgi:TP901 family phage tail tape measure protein
VSDRTVVTRLRLEVSDYVANANRAARATRTFVDDTRRGTGQLSRDLVDVKTQATVMGAALLALPAAATAVSMAFDKNMSNVRAVTGATADEMDRLRAAAIDAGQATVFSAGDAAQAEAELAKAGIHTADILSGALRGSLDLAAAGNLGLADAATISAQAMNTFSLGGRDVSHIADVLAAGANKSAADVSQLGDALRQGGLVADQTGLSLEDTVGVLSAFADRALIGSDAGTSLKTMLQRLTPQSKEAADTMDGLGISAYDAQGNFVGLDKFAQNLRDSLKDLDPESRNTAMSIIFGSDAVRAASILYDLGGKGIRDYTGAVNDQGAAARMAGVQLDNLAGDLEQLKGSVETALIQSGSEANGILRDMAQAATSAVNFIGDLPGPVLATGLAVTTMSGAFLIAAPRIVAVNDALAASPALAKAARIGMLGIGPAAAVAGIVGIATEMADANQRTQELEESTQALFRQLDKGVNTAGIEELRSKIKDAQQQINNPGFFGSIGQGIEQWRVWTQGADDAIRSWGRFQAAAAEDRAPTTLQRQQSTLADLRAEYAKYLDVTGRVAVALGTTGTRAQDIFNASGVALTGTVEDITAQVLAYSRSQSTGSVASHNAAAALDVLGNASSHVEDRLKALKQQWDATTGAMLDASDAQIAAERALDDMSKSLKDNGNHWDITTKKGQDNRSQLNDSIRTFEDLRVTLIETGKATEEQANAKMVGYLKQLRDELPKSAKGARHQLQTLIDKYSQIPAKKTTKVEADTSQVDEALAKIKAQWAEITHLPTAVLNAHYGVTGPKQKRAGGGYLTGPGTGTSDSIPIMASHGEFIVNAEDTAKNRAVLEAINSGQVMGYAKGGRVGRRVSNAVDRLHARGRDAYDYISQARAGVMSQGSIAGFDFNSSAYTQALEDQKAALADIAQAQASVARARLAADDAKTPLERARALDRLAAASSDLADAQGRLSDAQKTVKATEASGANILASQSARVKAAEAFAKDFAALRKAGLNEASLNEIRELGFVDGDAAARALLSTAGGIAQANSNQKRLAKAAGSIGDTAGLAKYGLTAGAAKGLMQVSITGGVHVHIPASVRPADRALIREEVHDAVKAAVDSLPGHLGGKGKR